MVRLFSLLAVILVLFAGGCASVSEDRISLLEAAVMDLQAQETRLASLEDTVASLVARNRDAGQTPPAAHNPQRIPAVAPSAPVPSVPQPAPVPAAPKKHADTAQIRQEYQAALTTFEARNFQTALGRFRNFLTQYPTHPLAPNAGYWLGECHYSMRHYEPAIAAFKDVVAQFPQHDKAAAAMLKIGYSHALLGDATNARFFFEMLVKEYPSSQPASLARVRLASL